MRLNRWIALALALCVLTGTLSWALTEESAQVEPVDPEVGEAEEVGGAAGLYIEGGDVREAEALIGEEDGGEPVGGGEVKILPGDGVYARARVKRATVYRDTVSADVLAYLGKGEVVLLTGSCGELSAVCVNIEGQVVCGYVTPSELVELTDEEVEAYMDSATVSGPVALYNGDANRPLTDLAASAVKGTRLVKNGNYTEYSNDKEFVLNGRKIRANMVPDAGIGNCWAWAQGIYKLVWDVNFDSTFLGTGTKGINMLRNLTDDERLLTTEHLKTFVQYAQPGATLRVGSCTSKCSQFQNDGLSCGHKGHSLIIVERRSDGVVTMDDHSGSQHTRFYSWQGFCNSWKNYTYIKYIKWPNAPALPSTESVDGYEVRSCSETYRVRATASGGAKVYSAPENGSAVATIAYPATFSATKRTTNTYGGYTWVYGSTSSGTRGWLPLDDKVVNVSDNIAVTGVSISQSKLVLVNGSSATLTATVLPEDATDKTVTWSGGSSAVATVSDGRVTAVGEGTCTVTVTTRDGKKKASCEVQVIKAEGSKTLSKTGSNGTVKMLIGQRLQLVPKFATKRGWKIKGVKLSNNSCATVDKTTGVVTANAVGKTVVTVTTKNRKKATLKIQIYDPYTLLSIKLNKKGTVRMKVGGTMKLKYKLSPTTATAVLTWKTSKPKVASIDEEGNVTAVGKGTCYVGIIADNGKYARVKVKVS